MNYDYALNIVNVHFVWLFKEARNCTLNVWFKKNNFHLTSWTQLGWKGAAGLLSSLLLKAGPTPIID